MRNILRILSKATGLVLGPTNTILLRNVGSPNPEFVTGSDHISARGFNLLLLDRAGKPRHYVKCRHSGSQRAIREAGIYAHLSQDACLSKHVANHSVHHCDGMHLLLCEFLQGQDLYGAMKKSPVHARQNLLRATLDVAKSIAVSVKAAGLNFPALDRQTFLTGFRELTNSQIENALQRVESLNCEYQHGDLTGQNVLIVRNQPVLIDFEAYAETQLPLFDAWNLVRSTSNAFGKEPWWQGNGAKVVREDAAKIGLTKDAVDATILSFAAVMGAQLRARGVPEMYWRPYFVELDDILETQAK